MIVKTKTKIIEVLEKVGIERESRNNLDVHRCIRALIHSDNWFFWTQDFIKNVVDDYVWGF